MRASGVYEVDRPANGQEQFAGIINPYSEQIVSDSRSSDTIDYAQEQGSRTHR